MILSIHPYFLTFIHPFALAHGTRTGTQLAIVKINYKNVIAYGEASLPPYRKESFDSVKNWVEKQQEITFSLLQSNPFLFSENIPFSKENPSASAALQSAILNWFAAFEGKKLKDYFPSTSKNTDLTLTITKNDFKHLSEKLALENHFTHFKLKLTGEENDLEFVKSIRKKTNLPFCIDINQGYTSQEKALTLIDNLEKENCILIEQPLKDTNHDGHFWLKQRTPLPIIADESICLFEDLVQFYDAYSGVNIKLMKCGGLIQAQKMFNFKPSTTNTENEPPFLKLLGCMTESSLGISTASVLASQSFIADLDAPYLCNNDPFEGFSIQHKKILLTSKISLKQENLFLN